METEEQTLSEQRKALLELQQWQREILAMESSELDEYTIGVKEATFLKGTQKKMIKECLSEDYFILRNEDRVVLRKVLERGFYYEWEKDVLNWIRKEYLKGKNFIK